MKNVFLALLLFVSGTVTAQITVTANVAFISPGDTNTQLITIDRGTLERYLPTLITLQIKCPSTNAGTVQINVHSSTMTQALTIAAGETKFVTVKNSFYVKLSSAADDLEISY